MKLYLVSITYFCVINLGLSQHLSDGIQLNRPDWDYMAVEKKMEEELRNSDKTTLFNPSKKWFGDTIQFQSYFIETSIVHRYMFERPGNQLRSDSKCIYQEYRTACDRCGDKLFKSITDPSKKYGFKIMADGSYLSKLKYRSKLLITHMEGGESCLRLVFLPVNIPDDEYMKLYNSFMP